MEKRLGRHLGVSKGVSMKKQFEMPFVEFFSMDGDNVILDSVGVDWNSAWGSDWDDWPD